MATPTSDQIRERAIQMFMSEVSGRGPYEQGAPPTPEDSELREGGYFERARNELMRESANLTPEQKEIALKRREELKQELAEVREALGYRPRPKRTNVEALVEAAKAPEPVAATVEAASRQELEDLPIPPESMSGEEERLLAARSLPGPTGSRKHFPGRYIPHLAEQAQTVEVEPVDVPEVTPNLEEDEALAAAAALVPRTGRKERYPGRYIPELAEQKQTGPKPPPAHKQLTASFRRALRSTTRRLSDYEKELRAQDEARRRRESEERRELQMFAREVNLAKRKRIILARATADVEKERERAEQGFGSGETPIRGLARAASRRLGRIGAPRALTLEGAPGLEEIYSEEQPEESASPYGKNFGRFPSHRYPHYHFSSARRTNRLHFRLGEIKPGARPSKGPRIRTSWSFEAALKGSARAPSYTKGAVPYSFELVRPEDKELREAQGRISE